MGRALRAALVAATCWAWPAAAQAATWSEPDELEPPATERFATNPFSPRVEYTPSGGAVVSTTLSIPSPCFGHCARPPVTATAGRGPGGVWSGLATLPRPAAGIELVADGRDSAFVLGLDEEEGADDTHTPTGLTGWALRLGKQTATQVATFWNGRADFGHAAASRAGHVVVVWHARQGRDGEEGLRTYAAVRRPGGRFGRPVPLGAAAPGVSDAVAAVNERGDVLAAWQRGEFVYARIARGGGRFAPRLRVGRARPEGADASYASQLAGAIDSRGRATVVWDRRVGPAFEAWSAQSDRGRAFGRRRQLDVYPSQYSGVSFFALRARPDELLAAWVHDPEHGGGVRVARFRGGRLDRAAIPGSEGTYVTGGDALADGTAALTMTRSDGSLPPPSRVLVSLRPPGGDFGPPEVVAGPEPPAADADVALHPATHQPTVVYRTLPPATTGDAPYPSGRLYAVDRRP